MHPTQTPDPMLAQAAGSSRSRSRVEAATSARQHDSLLPSDARPEDVSARLRQLIEAGQVGMACRLTAEAASRFPEHAELRKANRILNEWNVSSSPQVEPSTSEEIEWVKNPPVEVRGKWVALIGSQLVGIADTATELMELIRSGDLPQKPLVHHFAS